MAKHIHHVKLSVYVYVYFSVNVFGVKTPTDDTGHFYGTAISRGHPSHVKVQLFPGERRNFHFSVIFIP